MHVCKALSFPFQCYEFFVFLFVVEPYRFRPLIILLFSTTIMQPRLIFRIKATINNSTISLRRVRENDVKTQQFAVARHLPLLLTSSAGLATPMGREEGVGTGPMLPQVYRAHARRSLVPQKYVSH